ncbi:MAG: hypothetical protein QF747_02180 [Patescibacteria group bacterium]|jgi:hypothetical protein|nr:hypothetical protein [Patescibacteria group bacterium]|tara:strand:- start:1104 stop:1706 length:603 start_codon:yes stop_codon:yes gene_type:complete
MPQNQIVLLKQMIERAQKQVETATKMLEKVEAGEDVDISSITSKAPKQPDSEEEGEIVEGVFDGVQMIGNDSKSYSIPPNYASKSKLVEGDILKLTILDDGSFLYKQIGPVERKRLRGTLMQDEDTGEYSVMAQGNTFKVISASVTYFKGEVGDEVVILVPSDKQSQWAAVENIMKHMEDGSQHEEEPQDDLDKATADLL